MNIARIISNRKPMVALKVGKTGPGARMVQSHTGFLAGKYEIWHAALKQSGVLEVKTLEEMMDFARALSLQRPAEGERVGIITNGGGTGILCADAYIQLNLEVPRLSEAIRDSLYKKISPFSSIDNPIDLTVATTAQDYASALDVLIDSVLSILSYY
jgi:acyl-CoA synthetase (NDP forming)